jgi:hypothetical protein
MLSIRTLAPAASASVRQRSLSVWDSKVSNSIDAALREFRDRFNQQWIIGRIGYRTPAQHRRELLVEAA